MICIKLYGRHADLVHNKSMLHMLKGLFTDVTYKLCPVIIMRNVSGATCGAENAHSFRNT